MRLLMRSALRKVYDFHSKVTAVMMMVVVLGGKLLMELLSPSVAAYRLTSFTLPLPS